MTWIFAPDVFVDVPDEIDISYMRSKGLQPGEELLPEARGAFSYDLRMFGSLALCLTSSCPRSLS